MDHLRFQSSQTAASYVADQLDPQEQEAFELHMMSCPECVGEVESWRAIQGTMADERRRAVEVARAAQPDVEPLEPAAAAVSAAASASVTPARPRHWRVAVSLAAVALAGVAGGWYARSAQSSWSDSDNIAFYNLPAVSRGPADCLALKLDTHTSVIAMRVTGAAADQQLVAVDAAGRDLQAGRYSVRMQADGSWLLRLRSAALGPEGVRLEVRSPDGTVEPRGCLMSEPHG